jgi:hypothetical protein
MSQLPAPTGVTARYQGPGNSNFTTTFYYWIQAVYPDGNSLLSTPANTGAYCPAQPFPDGLVNVQWNPAPGAIGYYVYRSTSATTPASGALAIFIATSETGFKDDGTYTTFTKVPHYDGVYAYRALYDFAVDGGAISTITPSISDTIPANAIVYGGLLNSVTAPVGASATIAVGTSAGSSSSSILAATAITAMTVDAVIELLGVNSQAATHKPSFKMTAAGQITLTIATTALTAGRIEVMVFVSFPTNP